MRSKGIKVRRRWGIAQHNSGSLFNPSLFQCSQHPGTSTVLVQPLSLPVLSAYRHNYGPCSTPLSSSALSIQAQVRLLVQPRSLPVLSASRHKYGSLFNPSLFQCSQHIGTSTAPCATTISSSALSIQAQARLFVQSLSLPVLSAYRHNYGSLCNPSLFQCSQHTGTSTALCATPLSSSALSIQAQVQLFVQPLSLPVLSASRHKYGPCSTPLTSSALSIQAQARLFVQSLSLPVLSAYRHNYGSLCNPSLFQCSQHTGTSTALCATPLSSSALSIQAQVQLFVQPLSLPVLSASRHKYGPCSTPLSSSALSIQAQVWLFVQPLSLPVLSAYRHKYGSLCNPSLFQCSQHTGTSTAPCSTPISSSALSIQAQVRLFVQPLSLPVLSAYRHKHGSLCNPSLFQCSQHTGTSTAFVQPLSLLVLSAYRYKHGSLCNPSLFQCPQRTD